MKNNITMAMHWIVLGCKPGDSSGTAQILEKGGYVTDFQDNRKDVVVEHLRQLCSSQDVELNL
ncbi:hypothetical protein DY000_02030058 [Brassica cretica]|uniref:Uncharacterized protein n=1 Tax=Brassica cretica TaxID=69181 RepID=A0ABQ7DKG6_BRACR|nr:hypothetical protein DY000_02030058 [Brassica cretica]